MRRKLVIYDEEDDNEGGDAGDVDVNIVASETREAEVKTTTAIIGINLNVKARKVENDGANKVETNREERDALIVENIWGEKDNISKVREEETDGMEDVGEAREIEIDGVVEHVGTIACSNNFDDIDREIEFTIAVEVDREIENTIATEVENIVKEEERMNNEEAVENVKGEDRYENEEARRMNNFEDTRNIAVEAVYNLNDANVEDSDVNEEAPNQETPQSQEHNDSEDSFDMEMNHACSKLRQEEHKEQSEPPIIKEEEPSFQLKLTEEDLNFRPLFRVGGLIENPTIDDVLEHLH